MLSPYDSDDDDGFDEDEDYDNELFSDVSFLLLFSARTDFCLYPCYCIWVLIFLNSF